jgi:hypothetical protein
VTTFEWGMKKWAEAEAVASTLAAVYFPFRGISVAPPDCLKFHPAVRHTPTKQDLPALLALATDQTGEPLAVQCTYLARDGKGKAKVEKKDQRRTFGSPKGGAVKLAEPVDGMPLLLGEGVETTLTAIEATGYPGWATLGTSGLASINLADTVQEVILLAENDESGANQKAVDKVCPGLIERGIRVRIARPPAGLNDFNDLVKPEGSVGPSAGLVIAKMTIDAAQEWEPKRGRSPKPQGPKQTSQASFLVDLVISRCELFCDRHGEPHACLLAPHAGGEHRETHKLRSAGFNHWLRLAYYAEKNGAPSSEAMSTAIKTLMAKARYDGLRREVFLRSAALDGKVYVDLADDQWRAIEIDPDSYRVVDDPPVHFRREAGLLPLPAPSSIEPRKGIEKLRELLRLRDPRDFVIIVAWLLAALASRGPFTVLIFLGEPGATKSSTAYAVRSIVDPNASPLRLKPREPRDVFIAANYGLVVAYNNLSNLPEWLSDTLCVVSEGSGESRRELYTDADESLLYARAPFLLTGIENVVVRGDLAQRTLFIHLASVPNAERLTEDDFKGRLKRAHADILGALCGAVSMGLTREKTLKLPALPRMATFFHWVSACEPALWEAGTFDSAYEANAKGATEDVIEGEKAASVLRGFMASRARWQGTATQLLGELGAFVRRPVREAEAATTEVVGQRDSLAQEQAAAQIKEAREKARDILGAGWPKAPNALSGQLKRAGPALRKIGIAIEWPSRHGEEKTITIANSAFESSGRISSQASQASQDEIVSNDINSLFDERRDGGGPERDDRGAARDGRKAESGGLGTIPGDDCGTLSEEEPSPDKPLEIKETPRLTEPPDGRDDPRRPLSNGDPDDDSNWREGLI